MTSRPWFLAAALALPAWVQAHDYPTAERVVYVQACMRQHPGGYYEMLNKCSCVIDRIARALPLLRRADLGAVSARRARGRTGRRLRGHAKDLLRPRGRHARDDERRRPTRRGRAVVIVASGELLDAKLTELGRHGWRHADAERALLASERFLGMLNGITRAALEADAAIATSIMMWRWLPVRPAPS